MTVNPPTSDPTPMRNDRITALGELLEQVRAATGPDRELDARVWAELHGRDVVHRPSAPIGDCHCGRSRQAPHDECVLWTIRGEWVDYAGNIPRLTASTDATIALIERDSAYRADPDGFMRLCLEHAEPPATWDYSKPTAPQIARYMLVGYLSALLAQETTNAE